MPSRSKRTEILCRCEQLLATLTTQESPAVTAEILDIAEDAKKAPAAAIGSSSPRTVPGEDGRAATEP